MQLDRLRCPTRRAHPDAAGGRCPVTARGPRRRAQPNAERPRRAPTATASSPSASTAAEAATRQGHPAGCGPVRPSRPTPLRRVPLRCSATPAPGLGLHAASTSQRTRTRPGPARCIDLPAQHPHPAWACTLHRPPSAPAPGLGLHAASTSQRTRTRAGPARCIDLPAHPHPGLGLHAASTSQRDTVPADAGPVRPVRPRPQDHPSARRPGRCEASDRCRQLWSATMDATAKREVRAARSSPAVDRDRVAAAVGATAAAVAAAGRRDRAAGAVLLHRRSARLQRLAGTAGRRVGRPCVPAAGAVGRRRRGLARRHARRARPRDVGRDARPARAARGSPSPQRGARGGGCWGWSPIPTPTSARRR